MYMFRPSGITVDTDPYLPFFSVFMAIWAVLFVVVSVGKGVVFPPGGNWTHVRPTLESEWLASYPGLGTRLVSGLVICLNLLLLHCSVVLQMCDSHRHNLVDLGLGIETIRRDLVCNTKYILPCPTMPVRRIQN